MDNEIKLYLAGIGLVLILGVFSNRFSGFLKMPILLCFLTIGALQGPCGFGLFPEIPLKISDIIGTIALAYIMFSGGLQTSFQSVKRVFVTGTILSTLGVIFTTLLFGVTIWSIRYFSDSYADVTLVSQLLFAAIFSSTDAASVFAILRGQKAAINPKLQSLLEYESGSNDPAAFFMTTLLIGMCIQPGGMTAGHFQWEVSSGIVWGLGVGSCIGILFGVFTQYVYEWVRSFLEYDGLLFVVALAVVLLCYGCQEALFHANGMMACYAAGIAMGNMRYNFKQTFVKFHDGVSWFMQIMLFTMLGMRFNFHKLTDMGFLADCLLTAFLLMAVVRPVVVMLLMIRSPFNMRERLFTCWVGIRGSTPIMLGMTVLTAQMAQKDLPGGISAGDMEMLEYGMTKVFVVVFLSIFIQGSTMMPLAKKLGLVLPYVEKERAPLEYANGSSKDTREMVEFVVQEGGALENKTLQEIGRPDELVVLMIERNGVFLQPQEKEILLAHDKLSLLGEHSVISGVHSEFFPEQDYSPARSFNQIWSSMARHMKFNYFRKNKVS